MDGAELIRFVYDLPEPSWKWDWPLFQSAQRAIAESLAPATG